MAINYDKLFHMMIDRKITNIQLKDMAGVSANTQMPLPPYTNRLAFFFGMVAAKRDFKAKNCTAGIDRKVQTVP